MLRTVTRVTAHKPLCSLLTAPGYLYSAQLHSPLRALCQDSGRSPDAEVTEIRIPQCPEPRVQVRISRG